jgi:hypothetical protein
MFGVGLAGVAIVLVLAAAKSSILWVLLPLVGVLGYAYVQGKRDEQADEPPAADGDAPD